jgi:mRNA interferase HigB
MKLIGRHILVQFKLKHADVRSQVDAWEAEVKDAEWTTFHDIRRRYASASSIPAGRVIFNLKGNKYRLRVMVNYPNRIVKVDRAGTHEEYLKW